MYVLDHLGRVVSVDIDPDSAPMCSWILKEQQVCTILIISRHTKPVEFELRTVSLGEGNDL
jgi:hypothetical protein